MLYGRRFPAIRSPMASGDLGTLTAKLKLDTGGAEESLGKLSSMFGPLGDAAAAVGAAVLAIGTTATVLASKFQATTDLMAAQAGISAAAATKIGDAFLGTGGKVDFTAQQMMDAFEPVSGQLANLMGHALNSAQSLQVMKAAMDGAEASGQPLNDVTAALANTLVAFNLSTASSSLAMDTLFNASRILNKPISDISTGIDKLHGRLGEATPPLQQVTGLMVDLASNGLPAKQTISGLSTALTGLITPTKAQKTALEALHFSAVNSTGQFIGMDSVLARLGPKFDKMTEQQQISTAKTLFGSTAWASMLSVIQQGPAAFDKQTASIGKAGSAQTAAQTATDNLKGAFDRLRSGITDMLTQLGEKLTPIVTTVVTWFANHLNPALQDAGHFISTSVVPALQAMWGWFSNNILPIIQQVSGWFTTKLVPAFEGLAGSLVKNVFPAISPVVSILGSGAKGLLGIIVPIGEFITTTLLGAIKTLSDNFKTWETPLAAVVASFVTFKAVAVGGEIVQMFQFLASGGLQTALYGLGAASEAAFAPWVVASAPIVALAAAIASVKSTFAGQQGIGNPFGLTVPGQQGSNGKIGAGIFGGSGTLPPAPPGQTGLKPRALGGSVSALNSYMVGERGPELFTPRLSGTIIPHDKLGGGTTNNVYVYVTNPGASADDIARKVSWALKTAAV